MIISGSIHVTANGIIPLFTAELYSIVYIYHIFIHSSVNGHLGCFHVLTFVNSATMNLGAHVSFQIIGTGNHLNTGEITALFEAEGRGQEQSKSSCYRRERGEDYCVSVWGGREQTSGGGGAC